MANTQDLNRATADKIIEILQKRYQLEIEGNDEDVADEILALVSEPSEDYQAGYSMGWSDRADLVSEPVYLCPECQTDKRYCRHSSAREPVEDEE